MTGPLSTFKSRATHPTVVAVITLGITQILVWGTSFYALGVLGKPISADTGWSASIVFGGFTIAVLASSVISTPAGYAIDKFGARQVMSFGFIVIAAALWALSEVRETWQYFVVWLVIGLAMRLTLYDAAFAALVQIDPANGRRAIAYLTLFGGFASTVGWPAGHYLSDAYGWRDTVTIYAAVNLLVCLPLAWFGLMPRRYGNARAAANADNGKPQRAPLVGRDRTVAMILFSVVMTSYGLVFGVGAIHLVGIIEASGIPAATAVGLAAMKGVAQVGGRALDLVFGKYISPMMLGRISIALMPLSVFVLLFATGNPTIALLFTLIFGASNGLVTIVRGAVPLALFGPVGYGVILGILATPVLLFNAVSPLAFAMIVEAIGYRAGTWILLAIGVAGMVSMEVLASWYRRLA